MPDRDIVELERQDDQIGRLLDFAALGVDIGHAAGGTGGAVEVDLS